MQNPSEVSVPQVLTARQVLENARGLIGASRPTLETHSATYQAAVLLLVGGSVHFNVDRFARVAGFDRTFVAKAIRRLYDNGVLLGGELKRDWDETELTGSFWRDVAVAEGLLYRRESDGGEMEWGFPGSWWKAFDFGDTSQGSGSAVRYSYAVEEEEREATRPLDAVEAEAEEPEPLPVGLWESEPSWSLGSGSRRFAMAGQSVVDSTSSRTPVGAVAQGGTELFPDAVWLG
jgi:hypothetical protein